MSKETGGQVTTDNCFLKDNFYDGTQSNRIHIAMMIKVLTAQASTNKV